MGEVPNRAQVWVAPEGACQLGWVSSLPARWLSGLNVTWELSSTQPTPHRVRMRPRGYNKHVGSYCMHTAFQYQCVWVARQWGWWWESKLSLGSLRAAGLRRAARRRCTRVGADS